MRATWLPEVLRNAGLTVVEWPGWQTRGYRSSLSCAPPEMRAGELVRIDGLVVHDTGTDPRAATWLSQCRYIAEGGGGLAPISQLGVENTGTWYVFASGLANHAGASEVPWDDQGWPCAAHNGVLLGVECMMPVPGTSWPKVQVDSIILGTAAILNYLGLGADRTLGHLEVARPYGRKVDPRGPWEQGGEWWDETQPAPARQLSAFRWWVGAWLAQWAQPEPTPPPLEPPYVHVVSAGQAPWGIARAYGTTVDALRLVNADPLSVIHVGDKLAIPGRSVRVAAGKGWWDAAQRAGVPMDALRNANPDAPNPLTTSTFLRLP